MDNVKSKKRDGLFWGIRTRKPSQKLLLPPEQTFPHILLAKKKSRINPKPATGM